LFIVLLCVSAVLCQTCDITPSNPNCEVACHCFDFKLLNFSVSTTSNGVGTTYSFKVWDNCKYAVSYIAFGTTGKTVLAPPNGSTYKGLLGNYQVVYTNVNGNPGFDSVKFSAGNQQFANGAYEIFNITLAGPPDNRYTFALQGHAGTVWETFYMNNWSQCSCTDCNSCPAGFTGTGCDQCDAAPSAGYTWWCFPQNSTTNPYYLQLVQCSETSENCPSVGFSPSTTTVDSQGYTVSCNCSRVIKPCDNLNNCLETDTAILLKEHANACPEPDQIVPQLVEPLDLLPPQLLPPQLPLLLLLLLLVLLVRHLLLEERVFLAKNSHSVMVKASAIPLEIVPAEPPIPAPPAVN